MEDISNDLWCVIFSNLSIFVNLRTVARVCHKWREQLVPRMKMYIANVAKDKNEWFMKTIVFQKRTLEKIAIIHNHITMTDLFANIDLALSVPEPSVFEIAGAILLMTTVQRYGVITINASVSSILAHARRNRPKRCTKCGIESFTERKEVYCSPQECVCEGFICAKCQAASRVFCCVYICECGGLVEKTKKAFSCNDCGIGLCGDCKYQHANCAVGRDIVYCMTCVTKRDFMLGASHMRYCDMCVDKYKCCVCCLTPADKYVPLHITRFLSFNGLIVCNNLECQDAMKVRLRA